MALSEDDRGRMGIASEIPSQTKGSLMPREAIHSSAAPAPAGPYSHGVVTVGGLVFTAGFGPHDPTTGLVVGGGVFEQTQQALRNIAAVLAAAGTSMDDVVKVTAHLRSLDDFDEYNRAYSSFFAEPYPVRTTVGSELAGFLVEIDVVAQLSLP